MIDINFNVNKSLLSITFLITFRSDLCQAIIKASRIQDRSTSLMTTLATSLLLSFSPHEVVSDRAKQMCATALKKVSILSRRGYLGGSSYNTQLFADLVSSYSTNIVPTTRRRLSTSSTVVVTDAVSDKAFLDDNALNRALSVVASYVFYLTFTAG
jgi:hypothetical protein